MTEWKDLLPVDGALVRLARHGMTELCIDTHARDPWGAVASVDAGGRALMLSWDYVDVQFKFEIYVTAIEEADTERPAEWTSVATVAPGASVRFLVRAEWLRPALPGEVPESYEQVIEEAGRWASAPDSAMAGGVALRGLALVDEDSGQPFAAIGVDDDVGYSLRWISEDGAVGRYLADCDVLDLESLRRLRRDVGGATSGGR